MSATPNIGLQTPAIGSNNWGAPLNYNFAQLDSFLSGVTALPGLWVSGNVRVDGTLTVADLEGPGGATYLTSALFNLPNGVPQLNFAGQIPQSLFAGLGIYDVTFSATPVFDAALGNEFKITLSAAVTSSTFIHGTQGSTLVTFRIVQDGTGGWPFVWPANVRGGGMPAPGAGTRNIQVFALDDDGSLDAAGPMMTT
jgi:hypothetical protein